MLEDDKISAIIIYNLNLFMAIHFIIHELKRVVVWFLCHGPE